MATGLTQPTEFTAAQSWLANRVSVPTGMSAAELALSPEFPAAAKAQAFFSARVSVVNTLTSLRESVDAYAAGDINIAEARLRMKLHLFRKGWPLDDVATIGTPPAGITEEAWRAAKQVTNLGSTWRLDLILRTEARKANAIGQREVSMHPAVVAAYPNYRYFSRMDGAERQSHRDLNGVILPKGHPFWRQHTPPWDYGCRCWIEDAAVGEGATTEVVQQGGESWTVKTPGGTTVNVGANDTGYVFDVESALGRPDWTTLPDSPIKDLLVADFNKRYQNV